MEHLHLHAIVVKKPISLVEARRIAAHLTKSNKKRYVRETGDSYRFRIIPKTKFRSFVSKPINDNVTLVFGHLFKD